MGSAGITNQQELNHAFTIFFYMKMNPHIPFVAGLSNPFFFNNRNNNNFNNINPNINSINMNQSNNFMNNQINNMYAMNYNNNINMNQNNSYMNDGYMNNGYININQNNIQNSNINMNNMNNMNNAQQNSFMFMNNLNNIVNNNPLTNNFMGNNKNPMNMSINNMNLMNNNMNTMNMSMNNMSINNDMNAMNNMNPMNNNMNSLNNMNNMNMQNNYNQIFDELNTKFMNLNINQQQTINNALTQISSSYNSDLSNSTTTKSQSDYNDEITMEFKFLSGQIEKVKGRLDEKFYDVFKRFHEQCSEDLKNYVCRAIHNSKGIDNKKTLSENNIKNGDIICFFFEDENLTKYKTKENSSENSENENSLENSENDISDSISDSDEDEDEENSSEKDLLYKSWAEEYKCEIAKKFILKALNSNSETTENLTINFDSEDFLNFLNKKCKEIGKKINEHEHKLIYTITNFPWSCNLCKKKYQKNESRLYCSICDYNICNSCRKEKKYYIIANIPKDTEPSNKKVNKKFIKYKGHEHRLSYCRTKRTILHGGWLCDKCRDEFSNKIWTFYCTNCDYDLCSKCAEKEKLI